jgi:hypothetical protein
MLHNVRILRDEMGEIIRTQGIARDITHRKQAEERLKLSLRQSKRPWTEFRL